MTFFFLDKEDILITINVVRTGIVYICHVYNSGYSDTC